MVVHDMLIAQGKLKSGNGCSSPASRRASASPRCNRQGAGAKVIGTSGSAEKLDRLKTLGLDVGIRTRSGDFADAVMKATGGKGSTSS